MLNDCIIWHESFENFWKDVSEYVKETDVVLDIGCGIVPINFFRPSLHIMLEPYSEYVQILKHRHADDKSVFVMSGSAQETLAHFTDKSVDSIFLIDVIEHFEKTQGLELISEFERVAREQIVIFTPLGFMPQHAEDGEVDGWGLSGTSFQEHLSGWLPEDFGETWDFHVCETFHQYDFRQQLLAEPYGAMFAIKTFHETSCLSQPSKLVNIRRPLPSEIALEQTQLSLLSTRGELEHVRVALADTQAQLATTQTQLATTQTQLATTQAQLAEAQRILSHPAIMAQRKLWSLLKFWK